MLSLLLVCGASLAQDVTALPQLDAQSFEPSIDAHGGLWTDDSAIGAHLSPSARLVLHWVDDPLVIVYADGRRAELLGSALTADALAGISLWRLRVGARVPVVLGSSSDILAGGGGLGDLGLDLKARLLDGRQAPLGLAASARLSLPTSTVDAAIGGPGAGVELGLVADRRLDRLLLAANAGALLRPEAAVGGVTLGDAITLRGAAGWEISSRGGLSLDLASQLELHDSSDLAPPLEALLGGWWQAWGPLTLRGGLGKGLTDGVGCPDWRGVLALSWEPVSAPPDRDWDGLSDGEDACPELAEDHDGTDDGDGCPDVDNDRDGILDVEDACPDLAGPTSGGGCPPPDDDGDGVPDADDACPDSPGVASERGCPAGGRRFSLQPDDAKVFLPHPNCSWLEGEEIVGGLEQVELGTPVVIRAPGYLPAWMTLEAEMQVALEPAPAQGALLVLATPGDRVQVQGHPLELRSDGAALANLPEGPVQVVVSGGGRSDTLELGVSEGYATWARVGEAPVVRVLFAVGSSELRPSAQEQLGALAELRGGYGYALTGSFSPEGQVQVNRDLALARSRAVYDALVELGVPEEAIELRAAAAPAEGTSAAQQRACVVIPIPPGP